MNIEIVTEYNEPVAIFSHCTPTHEQLNFVYAILPAGACLSDAMKERWAVRWIACTPEWEQAQLKRRPMLKPQTLKLAFL